MHRIVVVLMLGLWSYSSFSQSGTGEKDVTREYEKHSFGFGLGIEYGSLLGLQYAYYFNDKIGAVVAGGIITKGLTAGAGFKYRPLKFDRPSFITPYIMAMATPVRQTIANSRQNFDDRVFYGALSGIGIELRDRKWKKLFLKFAGHIVYDFGQFDRFADDLAEQGVLLDRDRPPYTISLGIHYAL